MWKPGGQWFVVHGSWHIKPQDGMERIHLQKRIFGLMKINDLSLVIKKQRMFHETPLIELLVDEAKMADLISNRGYFLEVEPKIESNSFPLQDFKN